MSRQIIVFQRPKLIRSVHDGIIGGEIVLPRVTPGRRRVVIYRDEPIPWKDVPREWLPLLPWQAAITLTLLTSGTGIAGDASSYATASVTPGGSRLVVAVVSYSNDTNHPTATGNGLTWASLATPVICGAGGPYIAALRSMGSSPSAGAITFDFNGTSQNRFMVGWQIIEIDGVDVTGANGAGAIVQALTAAGTLFQNTNSITLAAFGSPNNFALGLAAAWGAATGGTTGGFTMLSDLAVTSLELASFYKANDTAVTFTGGAGGQGTGLYALEVKAAAGGPVITSYPSRNISVFGGR